MSDPNQLDDTLLSASNDVDDMATIRVPKPAASPTQAAPEAASPMGANPAAPVPFIFGRRIAKGGMGAILEASDCKLGRTIAVKVMLSEAGCSEEQKQRFIQEAAVLARLAHPNIVPVYDLGLDAEGELFYTMKLVKGRTLQHILDELRREHPEDLREFTLDRLLTIFRKVCDALAFAHAQNIIHRDLKPENIMVGEFGEVLVMDWGIAKMLDKETGLRSREAKPGDGETSDPALSQSPSLPLSSSSLTATMDGAVMGTPNYMSPEQAMGKVNELDARSDIFSLGGILYAILTLRPPVEGKDVWEVLEKVQAGKITAPTEFGASTGKGTPSAKGEVLEAKKIKPLPHCPGGRVPAALSSVVMKALTVERERRYQSTAEFSADVEAYQGGFATSAENAGALKQLVLLAKRHKGVTASLAAMLLLSVGFVIKVMASEQNATRHAEIAQVNEKAAKAAEAEAVAEKENVRRALAESALALAEAAYREANGPAMQAALDRVPSDLRDASWSYLLEQSDMSIARISAIKGEIRSVAAHPKQPGVFAVADDSGTVTILAARTGVRLLQFKSDWLREGAHSQLAFSPDGERITVGKIASPKNSGGAIAIHSARDGTKLLEWDPLSDAAELEFSPDGRRLLQQGSQSEDGQKQLNLWDPANGKLVWSETIKGAALRTRFTPDGRQLLVGLSGGGKSQLALRSLEDGSEIRTLGDNSGLKTSTITAMAIHPDGLKALWGASNGFVSAFNLRDGQLLFSTRIHPTLVRGVAFTRDGDRFVSVAPLPDGRQSIQVSNAKSGLPLESLIGGSGSPNNVVVHPLSGEVLIDGPNSRLWDVAGTAAKWILQSTNRSGTGIYSAPGAAFVGSDDMFLGPNQGLRNTLIDLRGHSAPWVSDRPSYFMSSVSDDGRVAALGQISYKTAHIQILRRNEDKFAALNGFDVKGSPVALRLSPTGDRLALATNGIVQSFAVVDPSTGSQMVAIDRKSLPIVHDYQWLGKGTQIIALATAKQRRGVTGSEERIIVWDAVTGQQVRSVVHPTALDCLVVAPDGKSFAAAGADKLVHVFDTETLAERQAFRAHDGPITALAWHPARPIVATASEDLTIKLWNLDTGRRLETLRGPTETPRVLNFSPSGQRLACASLDRTVRIWEPPSLNNATLDAPKADGWEDLLAQLKADDVKANGNGWTLSGGVLMSPEKQYAALPLAGNYARTSYHVHITLRRLNPKDPFAVILPVADQQVSFLIDDRSGDEFACGLSMVDQKKTLRDYRESGGGQQFKDTEPHDLEISVQLSARNARIAATLDDRPLYEWTGPTTSLSLSQHWQALSQPTLFLGGKSADWVVSVVKVKRLEK